MRLRILIIDNDRQLRAVLRAVLEDRGSRVEEASDDAVGLRALRREAFDLLVCDVSLRRRDGMETLRQVLREFPGLPVVALCGGNPDASWSLLRVARVWGAAQTLTKPFSPEELLRAVSQAVVPASPNEAVDLWRLSVRSSQERRDSGSGAGLTPTPHERHP
jgi:CheY-like chemotaxis protein